MSRLIHGDCLDEMKKLPDKVADVAITSPHYNMNLRVRNGKYVSRQVVKELSTKYHEFSDNRTMQEYFEFNKTALEQMLRLSDLVFFNIQMITGNKPALFQLLGHFSEQMKEMIVWDKTHAQPSISKGCMSSRYEMIWVLSQDKAMTRSFQNAKFNRGKLDNLWEIPRSKQRFESYHGATFPEELVSKIITNFTDEGDTVLDPFLGTGTTYRACQKEGRDCIGIEISKQYLDITRNQIFE